MINKLITLVSFSNLYYSIILNYLLFSEFNLNSCARYAVYETWMEYVPVFLNFMMLIICSKLSIYIARTRKLICDYFYYRFGKERTLELYNTRLSRRKQYMGERKTQIENFIKGKLYFAFIFTN